MHSLNAYHHCSFYLRNINNTLRASKESSNKLHVVPSAELVFEYDNSWSRSAIALKLALCFRVFQVLRQVLCVVQRHDNMFGFRGCRALSTCQFDCLVGLALLDVRLQWFCTGSLTAFYFYRHNTSQIVSDDELYQQSNSRSVVRLILYGLLKNLAFDQILFEVFFLQMPTRMRNKV